MFHVPEPNERRISQDEPKMPQVKLTPAQAKSIDMLKVAQNSTPAAIILEPDNLRRIVSALSMRLASCSKKEFYATVKLISVIRQAISAGNED